MPSYVPVSVQFARLGADTAAQRILAAVLLCSALGAAQAEDTPRAPPLPAADITVLALTGQPAPDGQGVIAGLRTAAPLLNGQGQVLFVADIHAADVHIDAHAVLLGSAQGGMQQLLRTGEDLPGGVSFGWLRSTRDICLDDDGRVAVFVPDDADDRVLNVLYRIDPSGRVEAVQRAGRHDHAAGEFQLGEDVELALGLPARWPPVFNQRGQVVFQAGDSVLLAEADGSLRTVARLGDELAGGRVVDILFAGDGLCRRGFNDAGQVVFYARISSDGEEREGIFLAEPR
jgi:hypothetical protein